LRGCPRTEGRGVTQPGGRCFFGSLDSTVA
jgi:hypothetical protein